MISEEQLFQEYEEKIKPFDIQYKEARTNLDEAKNRDIDHYVIKARKEPLSTPDYDNYNYIIRSYSTKYNTLEKNYQSVLVAAKLEYENGCKKLRVKSRLKYHRNSQKEILDYHVNRFRSSVKEIPSKSFEIIHSKRRFGVELEACNNVMSPEDAFPFSAVSDASISGQEFVSPIMQGDAGAIAIKSLCDGSFNGYYQPKANDACGFHLHVDMSQYKVAHLIQLGRMYQLFYPMICSLVDPKRVNRNFCQAWPANIFKDVASLSKHLYCDPQRIRSKEKLGKSGARYSWVNMAAYKYLGTVEVRLHEGTFDYEDIVGWINFHLSFVDWVFSTPNYKKLVADFPVAFREFMEYAPYNFQYVQRKVKNKKDFNQKDLVKLLDKQEVLTCVASSAA